MNEIVKQYALPILLSLIAGVSGYFQGEGAQKEETAKKVALLEQKSELVNSQQDKDIEDLRQDMKELTKTVTQDVKKAVQTGIEQGVTEALRTSKAGLNTPAVVVNEATLGHQ